MTQATGAQGAGSRPPIRDAEIHDPDSGPTPIRFRGEIRLDGELARPMLEADSSAAPMPEDSEPTSPSDRLLAMAAAFASQVRQAMAEAARRAAIHPGPPLEWRPPCTEAGEATSADRRWTA